MSRPGGRCSLPQPFRFFRPEPWLLSIAYLAWIARGRRRGLAPLAALALAAPVLRHRIVTSFAAESEGITPDKAIARLIAETPAKEGGLTSDPRLKKIFAA